MVKIQLWLRSYPCTDSYCQRLYWIRHHTRPISLVNAHTAVNAGHVSHTKSMEMDAMRAREGERGRERAKAGERGICFWGSAVESSPQAFGAKERFTLSHHSRRTDVHKHVQDYGMVTGPAMPRIAPNSNPTSTPSCVNGLGLLGCGACAG